MPRKGEYEKWIKGEGLKKIIEWVKSGLDDKQIAEDKIHYMIGLIDSPNLPTLTKKPRKYRKQL